MLDDLQAFMDLAAQVRPGEVLAQEDGLDGASELHERRVGGVLRAGSSEPTQDGLSLGCV